MARVLDGPRLDPATIAEIRAAVSEAVADALPDVVSEIVSEIRVALSEEIRAALAPRPRPSRAGLLLAIAEAVRDRPFTAQELIEHADVDATLAAALTRAAITNARSLSKYLWSIEGRAIGALRVIRIGEERDGIIWRCECAS